MNRARRHWLRHWSSYITFSFGYLACHWQNIGNTPNNSKEKLIEISKTSRLNGKLNLRTKTIRRTGHVVLHAYLLIATIMPQLCRARGLGAGGEGGSMRRHLGWCVGGAGKWVRRSGGGGGAGRGQSRLYSWRNLLMGLGTLNEYPCLMIMGAYSYAHRGREGDKQCRYTLQTGCMGCHCWRCRSTCHLGPMGLLTVSFSRGSLIWSCWRCWRESG